MQNSDLNADQFFPPQNSSQLSPLAIREPKSPGQSRMQGVTPARRQPAGQVPRFQKVKSASDIHPRVNAQPQFRRADPEGGFISVCLQISNC